MSAQTKHPSRARVERMLCRMAAANGISPDEAADQLDVILVRPDVASSSLGSGGYLAALCDSWLGRVQPRAERSDRGQFHTLPEKVWDIACTVCSRTFSSSRWDADYCSPACRQRAYRNRTKETPA